MQPRVIDCIYLQPSSTLKNVHEFYNVSTKKVRTRQYYTTSYTYTSKHHQHNRKIGPIRQHAYGYNVQARRSTKNNLWLAGVDELDNNFQHNKQTNETLENEMNINEIHEIIKVPSDFHTPNNSYYAYILTMNQNSAQQPMDNTNDIQIDQNRELSLENYNTFNNEMLDNIFENTDEEDIFNYDEVDEYKLENQYKEDSNQQHNNIITKKQII